MPCGILHHISCVIAYTSPYPLTEILLPLIIICRPNYCSLENRREMTDLQCGGPRLGGGGGGGVTMCGGGGH